MKYLSLVLVLLFSSNLFAGEWSEPLSIVDVSVSVNEGRFAYRQLRATFDMPPKTSICAATENIAVLDSASNSDLDHTKMWLSALMSAQAQNKKVRIYMTECRANNVPLLYGVKILSH